ncbi:MAG: Type secretion system transporter, HlyB family [Moraxellaceae bacterium]|jgi:subfamily B ATP-binding cassette protein HlyB/CyaB|nr:Type secretion system transporter, HlyB family [Moraxellaceae bacterium]
MSSVTDESPVNTGTSAAPPLDTGLICLVMLARFHQVAVEPSQLAHEFGQAGTAFGIQEMLLAAKKLGLKARPLQSGADRLEKTPLPAIAASLDGGFFIIAKAEGGKVLIQDPREQAPRILSQEELLARWSGQLVLVASRASVLGDMAQFDFTWFIPAIVKYRHLLRDVLVVSFFIQLLALISPLFFQVTIDKVLGHRSYSTLDVLCFGLLVVSLFEVLLGGLRTYVFSHTTNRIDVELGSRLFRHLLALPLPYFGARRVGDSVARVRELENIRNFLTSSAVTVVLDLFFAIIFIAVMLYYSVGLTLIVLVSLPCYVILSLWATPIIRSRLNEKFARGAENQAFLVESVSSIETVKSLAVEPQMQRHWDNQIAAYVAASFRAGQVSNIAGQGAQFINKAVTVLTLWFGARAVMEGQLTVGQFVAFNMLAQRVSAPVLRLTQLWQDFQQAGISVKRLADILNTRTEVAGASRSALPPAQGRINFDQVVFRYRPDGPETLRGIDFELKPGEVVGFVGRSGSGKSTIAKLVQRLYVPERGRVMVDGVDLALVDPAWLRRQIGVVQQENRLFNRSIRDNIALGDPGLPIERVIAAAKLAGAHEFILELPEAYDTIVGEQGASLSGGQRQRIAIARALVTNPRILIFDEATSALDYESERIIQQNMQAICQGRTVIIIAHRLTALRNARRIFVIDKGQLVEQGTPEELLEKEDGLYRHLFAQQQT